MDERPGEQTAEHREERQTGEAKAREGRGDGAARELREAVEQNEESDGAPARQRTDDCREDDEAGLLGQKRDTNRSPRPSRHRPRAPRGVGQARARPLQGPFVRHQPPAPSASARRAASALSAVGRQPPVSVRARTPVTLATAKLRPLRFRSGGMPGAGRG